MFAQILHTGDAAVGDFDRPVKPLRQRREFVALGGALREQSLALKQIFDD